MFRRVSSRFLQVGDCSVERFRVVVELAHSVVAVVADPAPELVGVVVVVQYDVPTPGDVPVTDRAVE